MPDTVTLDFLSTNFINEKSFIFSFCFKGKVCEPEPCPRGVRTRRDGSRDRPHSRQWRGPIMTSERSKQRLM